MACVIRFKLRSWRNTRGVSDHKEGLRITMSGRHAYHEEEVSSKCPPTKHWAYCSSVPACICYIHQLGVTPQLAEHVQVPRVVCAQRKPFHRTRVIGCLSVHSTVTCHVCEADDNKLATSS
ncbi:hypothetical protein BaRGS_00017596 [Batillaria attramentaria]|uniref:Uncharacterized protein n=1 Tax=Batillaria attramentaria TaxID=370345 RepID=A0ABD0KVB8_9CAEN